MKIKCCEILFDNWDFSNLIYNVYKEFLLWYLFFGLLLKIMVFWLRENCGVGCSGLCDLF